MIMKNNNLSKNRSRLSSRKGVSLVEVVVALAVISIISFAAFSLILSSIDLENNMMRDVEISAAADDALDCFIFANSGEKFSEVIKYLGYVNAGTKYRLDKGNYVIEVTYSETQMDFKAKDENDNIIFKFEKPYTKG
jgi:prepilin-type N-terminal cleavage/methylation domain-containing protein